MTTRSGGIATPPAEQQEVCTVVVPVFNEEACIAALFVRLQALRAQLAATCDLQVLFVDDGSRDSSLAQLLGLAQMHEFVRVLGFSRNFGHQMAITAGIDHASGEWVAVIDADLQDPPELLADMLALARQGHDVVYGQRSKRKGETVFKKWSASAFYRLLSVWCEIDIPRDTGDFRLMSRRVVEVLKSLRERHRFVRGMVPWVGFRQTALAYERDPRFAGETKYPLRKMLKFAANAIFSFSAKPLALASWWGVLLLVPGGLGALGLLAVLARAPHMVSSTALIVDVLLLLAGVQALLLGVQGEYVARLFEEAKARPLYVIAISRNPGMGMNMCAAADTRDAGDADAVTARDDAADKEAKADKEANAGKEANAAKEAAVEAAADKETEAKAAMETAADADLNMNRSGECRKN